MPITFIECDNGTYGYNCANNCSGHCLNGSPCNINSGHCDRGCAPGYNFVDCNKGEFTDKCTYPLF